MSSKSISVTQTKSPIGRLKNHKACLVGLGLRRIGLHQQVLINSSTPSTSALSDSLPQPSTTPTALGSPFTLASF